MKELYTRYFYLLALCIFTAKIFAQVPLQINGADGIPVTRAAELHSFNGLLYFNGDIDGKYSQLIRSDGTNAGTYMPKFIACQNQWGECGRPTKFIQVNDQLFFCQYDSLGGVKKLWVTDIHGSTPKKVGIFNQSNWQGYTEALAFKNKLFFILDTYDYGTEIWFTDGTNAGTQLLKDMTPGPAHSSKHFLTELDGLLYFFADDGVSGCELWKTDGTTTGTSLVKDINPGSGSSVNSYNAIAHGGSIYFAADNGINGVELWKSDGTSAGTNMVKDLNPGPKSSSPQSLVTLNDVVYFVAADTSYQPNYQPSAISNFELFRSDGTPAGTYLVKDINGSRSKGSFYLNTLHVCNGKLVFAASPYPSAYSYDAKLFRSDGTSPGTVLLKDVYPVGLGPFPGDFEFFGNDTIFFRASSDLNGQEIWMTNGEANGTHLVCNQLPGSNKFSPSNITVANNTLYFTTEYGAKLWKMNIPRAVNMDSDIGVFPNPFNDELRIYFKEKGLTTIKVNVYNLLGERIYKGEFFANNPILVNDLNRLPDGVYIIEVINGQQQHKQKLVKRR